MRQVTTRKTLAALAVMLTVGFATLWAQAQVPDPGSLAALTAEIRQLRVAVEESGRTQGQTQALAIYISAQRDRMVQMAARFDATQRELDGVSRETAELGRLVTGQQTAIATMPQQMRAAMTDELRVTQQRHAAASAREQALQTRVLEMSQSLQTEEARWSELISRLEQTIRR
jgi:hypothetical protein